MNAYEKMRQSVEKARNLLLAKVITGDNKMRPVYDILSKALALPRRNCDVGTPEGQKRRFEMFCKRKGEVFGESAYCAYSCPCGESVDCKLAWAQMPYTEEGGAR